MSEYMQGQMDELITDSVNRYEAEEDMPEPESKCRKCKGSGAIAVGIADIHGNCEVEPQPCNHCDGTGKVQFSSMAQKRRYDHYKKELSLKCTTTSIIM